MSKGSAPSAWDDDWTSVADQSKPQPSSAKLSKSEKRAQHQQLQKELWASAEDPSRNLWLETKGATPLKQAFTPSMTVLSRKPATVLAKRDVDNGVAGLSINDEDDSEEEAKKKRDAELEERQRKAKLEREEKVRKYAEARERIMGSSTPTSPRANADSRESSQGRSDSRRQRGANNRGANMDNTRSQQTGNRGDGPARTSTPTGQLFDPEDMTRRLPRKDNRSPASGTVTPREGEPIRQPRGPDSSGKSGFGFGVQAGGLAP